MKLNLRISSKKLTYNSGDKHILKNIKYEQIAIMIDSIVEPY